MIVKRRCLLLLMLCLALSVVAVPAASAAGDAGAATDLGADADREVVHYAIDNGDLSRGLEGWDTGDAAKFAVSKGLTLKPGAALWRAIPVTGTSGAPAAGDVVHARATVLLGSDVTVDDNVLIRLNAGSVLAEINDLGGVVRGKEVALESAVLNGGGAIAADQQDLWVEIHNDTPGTIELAKLEVWGEAEGSVKPYAVYDFSVSMDGWDHNGADKSFLSASLLMQPGAAAWRNVPFGEGAEQPQPGDRVQVSAELFVPAGVNRTDGVFVRVHDAKGTQVDVNDIADTPSGSWFRAADASRTGGGILHDEASEIWVELHNETDQPVRIRNVDVSAEREMTLRKFDLDEDGTVDGKDEKVLADWIKLGKLEARGDYDADGQLTGKDLSYFRKFGLKRADEVYLNLRHFNFMNEKIEIGGVPMFITHLYAEPLDRSDPSLGYGWVGDPQEGLAAVDDVARAVIVYAEHYRTFGDAYSYDMIKRGLEFLMWMQHEDGDFDNFVVRDADGTIHPKDSHSSQKSFSWWAARAYEAMGTALPLLGTRKTDRTLADRVEERLQLSLQRLKQMTDPQYGEYDTTGGAKRAKWLLAGDVWVSSIAVNALHAHYHAVKQPAIKKEILESARRLGEAIYLAKGGTSFRDFPYGGIMHHYEGMSSPDRWEEWGSIQVRALAYAGQLTGNREWIDAAAQTADSFIGDLLISGRAENLHPNKKPYPLINYGTASYVDNLLALYEVTGSEKYAVLAGIAGTWWTGNNVREFPMFDQKLGYAYDGLTDQDVNINSGGESVDEALRALLRIRENPVAQAHLLDRTTSVTAARTIEIERLYQASAPPDALMTLPGGELNDPDRALAKQGAASGTDEAKIYADAMNIGEDTAIYEGWQGAKTIFVAASGYNNIRLFDGGAIRAEVPVGGQEGHLQIGDSVKLQFDSRVEFDTALRAEVFAVDAAGGSALVADANDMSYHARTWYSGDGAVKTTPRAPIPDGTVKLVVQFSVSARNPNPHEGYASIAAAKLYRMMVPEVRYANPDVSGGGYVAMPAGQEKTFTVEVPASGLYDVMLSSVAQAVTQQGEAPRISVGFDDRAAAEATLPPGPAGRVTLERIASVTLAAGAHELRLHNPNSNAAAQVDAILLYPVESAIAVEGVDGKTTVVVRDGVSQTLFIGTAEQAASRDRIAVTASATARGNGAYQVTVKGTVTDAAGEPIAGRRVEVAVASAARKAVSSDQGEFAVTMTVSGKAMLGGALVTAVSSAGEGTAWLTIAGN